MCLCDAKKWLDVCTGVSQPAALRHAQVGLDALCPVSGETIYLTCDPGEHHSCTHTFASEEVTKVHFHKPLFFFVIDGVTERVTLQSYPLKCFHGPFKR